MWFRALFMVAVFEIADVMFVLCWLLAVSGIVTELKHLHSMKKTSLKKEITIYCRRIMRTHPDARRKAPQQCHFNFEY
jgi:hypothetical protein